MSIGGIVALGALALVVIVLLVALKGMINIVQQGLRLARLVLQ